MKGIIMDWDDTIVDFDYWVRIKWLYTTKWVENQLGIRGFDHKFWELYNKKSIYYFHKVRDTLLSLGFDDESGIDELSSIITNHSMNEKGEDLIFPGAADFLKTLKDSGWKIALLTMGHKKTHEKRIKETGFYQYFDVIKYGDIDKKPSMIPFLECIEQMDIEGFPVIVGDDQRDLLAPYYLGMETFLIDHKGVNRPMFTDKIKKVSSFNELKEIIIKEVK